MSKNAWEQVEIGPRRVLPARPAADADLGEIRWNRWELALLLTHFDPSCEVCGFAGPLAVARGMTLHQDPPRRKLLRRSAIAKGQRPVWGAAVTPEPRWIYTHWARRCQACDEMEVWCMSGKRTRCGECGALSPKALDGTRARCPACRKQALHAVPGGMLGKVDTWCTIAYNPPRAQEAAPLPRRAAPQKETLF